MTFKCDCKCHRICHICGQPFIGPNDYHINCGDMVVGSPTYTYTQNVQVDTKPWPDD